MSFLEIMAIGKFDMALSAWFLILRFYRRERVWDPLVGVVSKEVLLYTLLSQSPILCAALIALDCHNRKAIVWAGAEGHGRMEGGRFPEVTEMRPRSLWDAIIKVVLTLDTTENFTQLYRPLSLKNLVKCWEQSTSFAVCPDWHHPSLHSYHVFSFCLTCHGAASGNCGQTKNSFVGNNRSSLGRNPIDTTSMVPELVSKYVMVRLGACVICRRNFQRLSCSRDFKM